MPKVRFLRTCTVKAVDGPTFEEGKIYDLPIRSVEHWIRRGAVEMVTDKPHRTAVVETASVAPAENAQSPAAKAKPRGGN